MTMKMANNNEQSFENAQIEINNNKIERKKNLSVQDFDIYTYIIRENNK